MNRTNREFLVAAQYLLIGLIALAVTLHWFGDGGIRTVLLAWLFFATTLSIARVLILLLNEWVQGNRWQSIRRRNWD